MRKAAIILLVIFWMSRICEAAYIYVNHDGNDTAPYDTEAKACTDVNTALRIAERGDTIWLKADANYVLGGDQQAAMLNMDGNSYKVVCGYYQTIGDQNVGGAYYKDANYGWAIIDANNGSHHALGVVTGGGSPTDIAVKNIKFTNINFSYYSINIAPANLTACGWNIINCWFTGGVGAIYNGKQASPFIDDCKFTGTYSKSFLDAVILSNNEGMTNIVVQDCNFSHGNAYTCIRCNGAGTHIIRNNLFNISGAVNKVIKMTYQSWITNNTIYENSGGTITTGIDISAATSIATEISNNIIVGCTTSINDEAAYSGYCQGGWNCFYNNGTDWTLRYGDIQADPQFIDAANDDFRLQPTSPCLNTGKHTLNNGYTTMGAVRIPYWFTPPTITQITSAVASEIENYDPPTNTEMLAAFATAKEERDANDAVTQAAIAALPAAEDSSRMEGKIDVIKAQTDDPNDPNTIAGKVKQIQSTQCYKH